MSSIIQLNDYNSFVLRIGEVLNTGAAIKALFDISEDQWDRSINAETKEHLIKDVFTSGQKGDAVKVYITKLMRAHMASRGDRLAAWTKDTIGSENATNVAISNRIAATEFKSNTGLFMLVAGRLMGYDDSLINFAITDPLLVDTRVELLMEYISGKYDLADPDRMAKDLYMDAFDILKELLSSNSYSPKYVRLHSIYSGLVIVEEDKLFNNWDVFVEIAMIIKSSGDVDEWLNRVEKQGKINRLAIGVNASLALSEIPPADTSSRGVTEGCAVIDESPLSNELQLPDTDLGKI